MARNYKGNPVLAIWGRTARVIDEVAREIGEKMAKMKEQSRAGGQVDENKQAVSVEGQGSESGEQGSGVEDQGSEAPAAGPKAEEGTSDPATGATEPAEEPQTA